MIPRPPLSLPPSAKILLSLSPSSIPTSDLPITFVFRFVPALLTLYIGIPLPGERLLLVTNVLGNTRRSIRSNCLRKGGSEATRMPTESSVADQMVRFTPSQVGSVVLRRAESSTVLKMEQMVALAGGKICLGEIGGRGGAYMRPRQKTTRRPHWVFEGSCTEERYKIGATM